MLLFVNGEDLYFLIFLTPFGFFVTLFINHFLGGIIMSQQRTSVRNSNLELFRIIVMLLIVAHHYVANSGLLGNGPILETPTSGASLFLLLFGAWGKTGINCFVLITGYFMCKSAISAKKYAKLLLEVIFYNIVITFLFWVFGYGTFSLSSLIGIFFPVTEIGVGFTSAYLVFFLFIPFLNILVNHMTQKQHIYLLLLVAFTYVLTGTLKMLFTVYMNYVSWFSVLYLFSSYVRLYPNKYFSNTKLWGWLTLCFIAISAFSVVAGAWMLARFNMQLIYYFVADSNTFLALMTGLSSFMYFNNVRIPNSRLINTIAASTFGVLLIHTNSDLMRQWLWVDVLDNVGTYGKSWMPLHAVGSVLAIYLICTLIDYLRIRFIEMPFFRLWDRYYDKAAAKFKKWETKIMKKLGVQNP